ncbi:hypothetical protein HKX17_18155 [Sulfitobacter sp. KE34]|uniref:hypothetical protein n=1 Tax=unclassified Sulfitobacter TaxID=196795 RepID=UPI0023E122AF|nr:MULTISPECIES: hypothetical protein [unclassified Sulfitobacter]MDF3352085.1 hypothetical protein [Sulfitobacter sp. KE12]MDF3355729.1 hypothetical protein [Sulfitobacter sp. KE27]MDF3359368.1 hypothetical protein [Sulfitobacter sp. KE33]MDF3366792.1 hypothetical protein [Sulfitobacter sp. Ks34]MDF3370410.1 hypothetical protein [Sulfitobacter sp. Ks43]
MKRIGVSTFALIIAAASTPSADQHAGDQRTYSGIITTETSPNTLRAEGSQSGDDLLSKAGAEAHLNGNPERAYWFHLG